LVVLLVVAGLAGALPLVASPAHADTVTDTISVPGAVNVAVDQATNRVYVSDGGQDSVTVIDGTTDGVIATVPISGYAATIAVNPATDRIYVVDQVSALHVIDGSTNTVVDNVAISSPKYVSVNPSTNIVYVLGYSGSAWTVYVVDGATDSVTATIPLTGIYAPNWIDANPNGNQVYAAATTRYNGGGTLFVIDGSTNAITHTLTFGNPIWYVSHNPNSEEVYATENTAIDIIDGSTDTVTGIISGPSGDSLYSARINPSTGKIYAADDNDINQMLYVYDRSSGALLQTITLGKNPFDLSVDSATDTIYVDNQVSYTISVINGGSGGTSQLTISTQDTSGNALSGYYTVLNQSGSVVASGFTPHAFTLNDGQTYTVQVDNFGGCTFSHWSDTGSTTYYRTVSISSDTAYTAVMNCGGGGGQSGVTVNSVDSNNNAITGYYTVLYDSGGNAVSSQFTPASFATTSGSSYSVQVDNYGSCTFAKWSDGVTSDPRSFAATSSTQAFTAVYNCSGGGGGGGSSVTANTVDQAGDAISGYHIALYDANSNYITSGFSPATFSTTSGQGYKLVADSYGSCTFSHWSNGMGDPMSFTATSSPQTFTAIYNCTSSNKSTIDVSTVSSSGGAISGYWITLWQDGAQLQSCFSPCSFTVDGGQQYQLLASSYGSESFDHWQNDGSTGYETVTVPIASTTLDYTAVYSP
jgi:YVTN family beta-propeller protein